MNCERFISMTPQERDIFFMELIHAVSSDPVCMLTAQGMIRGAKDRGVFDNVKFYPERETLKIDTICHY
jgi:hypothetical protein